VRYILAIDMIGKVVLFIVVAAMVYIMFAHWAGSFNGSEIMALRAVGSTIAGAASFENLTGAYLYATAISTFPLFLGACIEIMQESPAFSRIVRGAFFFLPFKDKPIRAIAVVVGTFFAMFGVVVTGIAGII
jgi:hypothetical protein